MRKGGGKAKGSEFERKIAKDIVKAFRKHGITQRDCWRSINSGGHAIACGDLEMSEKLLELFPYSVECKFRRKIKWQNFMTAPNKSEEQKWIRQAKAGAEKISGLYPILVVKENFGETYVLPCGGYEGVEWIMGRIIKWTTFIKNCSKERRLSQNVAKESNSHKGKPRETERRFSSGRT